MDELEDGADMQNNSVEKEEIKPIKRKGRPPKAKCEPNEGYSSPKRARSFRRRAGKAKEIYQPKHVTWKLKEKKLLLQALKNFSPTDIESIQSLVKSKTKEEISHYIEKMKKGAVRKIKANKAPKAPIEYWLNLLSDLTSQEKKDYTINLGKVMSIIANFEVFPEPGPSTPDYKAIYKYISGMLSESELPDLGKLESAVILDLLHGLVDFLRSHHTTKQREVMLWKYNLLAGKVDMNDPLQALIKARKAIENDFSDLCPENGNSQPQSSTAQSSTQSSVENQPGPSTQPTQDSVQSATQPTQESVQSDTQINSKSSSSEREPGSLQTAKKRNLGKERTKASKTPCPRKPTLFTMNPLCIPVDLIKMTPIMRVPQGQLNRLVPPPLPNTQRKVTDPMMPQVHTTNISPHPKLPVRRQQQLHPAMQGSPPGVVPSNEMYICELHPDQVIVNPKARKMKEKTKKSFPPKDQTQS